MNDQLWALLAVDHQVPFKIAGLAQSLEMKRVAPGFRYWILSLGHQIKDHR